MGVKDLTAMEIDLIWGTVAGAKEIIQNKLDNHEYCAEEEKIAKYRIKQLETIMEKIVWNE